MSSQDNLQAPPPKSAYLILFCAQLAVGAAAIFARYALHGSGPVAASALRLTIASVPLLLYSLLVHRKKSLTRAHEFLFALSGLGLAIHFVTWIASLQFTSVAVSVLLVSTAPVWSTLYDVLVLKRKIEPSFWYALLAGAAGMFVIVGGDTGGAAPRPGFAVLGNFLAVCGGFAFAGYLIAVRSVLDLYPTVLVVGRTYSWAAFSLIVTMIVMHESPPPGNDLTSWGGIIGMALISQMLGHTGINAALRFFPASTVAFSTLLEPVFAALLGALLLCENLSLQTICGSVVVLISLGAILRQKTQDTQMQIAVESNQL